MANEFLLLLLSHDAQLLEHLHLDRRKCVLINTICRYYSWRMYGVIFQGPESVPKGCSL